jgi:membrane-associated phospholipid phosphatase
MLKFVAVLVWPLGIALIAAIAAVLARRTAPPAGRRPALNGSGNDSAPGRHGARTSAHGNRPAVHGIRPAVHGIRPAAHGIRPAARGVTLPGGTAGLVRLAVAVAAGAIVCCGLTVLLGLLVVHAGPAIDKPFQDWMVTHRLHLWASVMKRATKEADTWTTWGAAGTAAVCLAVTWRANRWLPPVALASLIVVDKYVVIAIHHVVHRAGPPTSPLGTFPSGGASRAVVFYGLIAYLLWREFSGTRRAAVWYGAAVAALAFNEGYSRAYLTLHWLTDVLSGWVFGCLLLAAYIAAVRFVIGPARPPLTTARAALPAAARAPAP